MTSRPDFINVSTRTAPPRAMALDQIYGRSRARGGPAMPVSLEGAG